MVEEEIEEVVEEENPQPLEVRIVKESEVIKEDFEYDFEDVDLSITEKELKEDFEE